MQLLFVSMDVINVNNGSSSHFESRDIAESTPSVIANGTTSGGKFENQVVEGERSGRKRKTRRFKSRYKGKSSKKSKYGILKKMRSTVYPQSEAPNNTNQFLMAEHTIENLDDKLSVERSRRREPSFTSADSDDGQFYSSPEDEDEFLTKDFDDTYQSVCAEKFGNLSKAQLTKIIFELEAKVEELSKKMVTNSKVDEMSSMLMQMNGTEGKDLRLEIKDILLQNERLRAENEELKQFIKENAVTTSSSSSSSSSDDSDSDTSEEEENTENQNADDQRTC